jgi:MFS transporter, ACS family, hexuronate transporter
VKAALDTEQWTPARLRRVGTATIALLSGVWVIDYIDRVMVGLALPFIGGEFALDKTQEGALVTAFAVVYMLSQVPGGILADRVGSRKLLVTSLVMWSVFTALTGLAAGFISLLVIRGLFGLGQGLFPGATFKALAERTTPGRRARAGACLLTANQLGAGLGPLLVAPVLLVLGWRDTFWAVAAAGVGIGILLWSLLPKPLPARFTAGEEGGGRHYRTSARTVMRAPAVWKFAALFCAFNMLSYGMITWVPSYLLEVRGISLVATGVLASIPLLVNAVFILIGGWLFDRYFHSRTRLFIIPVLLLTAVLLVLMLNTGSVGAFTLFQTLAMGLSGLATIGVVGLPLRALPPSVVGSGMGVINLGGQTAGVLAPVLMGWLADTFSYRAAFGLLVVSTRSAALLALIMPRRADEFDVSVRKEQA